MFSLYGSASRLCDRWSRRELLTVGGLSLVGLSLPAVLRHEAMAREAAGGAAERPATADSVVLVYLQGSPSHIDLWDPKPDAPAEIRGEFRPIPTRTPGLLLGEVLPQLAEQSHHYTVVRSIGVDPKGLRNHGAAIYMLMTGHDPTNFSPTGLAREPSRDDLPAVSANVAKYRPAKSGHFSNVALCSPVLEARVVGVGQTAGLLGAAYDPYTMYEDATRPIRPSGFTLPDDMPLEQLAGRLELRRHLDEHAAAIADQRSTFDSYYQTAMSLIQTQRAVRAFRLEDEPEKLRDRYGRTRFGQSLLLARRLVEAETRFIQVTWPARSDDEPAPGPDGSWDTHRNNFTMLREHRCPVFDESMSAFIEDMAARGLLERTLVIAIGEFGRSPRIGAPTTDNVGPGGRDHWPECYSFLIAGGGVQPGRIYGKSDRYAAYPADNPVHPYDLIATIYHALGIDPQTEYLDTLGRPRRLVQDGQPILGLF